MNSQNTRPKREMLILFALSLVLLVAIPDYGYAQGVVFSNQNSQQVATLHWYAANQTTQFSTGKYPCGVAFDGANIWVVNHGDNSVTKLRANDGTNLGTFPAGSDPYAIAYDGANIWITDAGGSAVTKLQASNGVNLGSFTVGAIPSALRSTASTSGWLIRGVILLPNCERATGPYSALLP